MSLLDLVLRLRHLIHLLEHMRVTLISVVLRHMVIVKVQVTYTLDNHLPMVVVLLTMEITLLLRLTLSLVMI